MTNSPPDAHRQQIPVRRDPAGEGSPPTSGPSATVLLDEAAVLEHLDLGPLLNAARAAAGPRSDDSR